MNDSNISQKKKKISPCAELLGSQTPATTPSVKVLELSFSRLTEDPSKPGFAPPASTSEESGLESDASQVFVYSTMMRSASRCPLSIAPGTVEKRVGCVASPANNRAGIRCRRELGASIRVSVYIS